jgi:hypothetical protein
VSGANREMSADAHQLAGRFVPWIIPKSANGGVSQCPPPETVWPVVLLRCSRYCWQPPARTHNSSVARSKVGRRRPGCIRGSHIDGHGVYVTADSGEFTSPLAGARCRVRSDLPCQNMGDRQAM